MLQPLLHIYLCIEVSRLRSPHALSHSKSNQLWGMDLTSSATWRHRRRIDRTCTVTRGKVKLGSNQRNQTNGRISSIVRQGERGMPLFIGHLLIPDYYVRHWWHSLCHQEVQELVVYRTVKRGRKDKVKDSATKDQGNRHWRPQFEAPRWKILTRLLGSWWRISENPQPYTDASAAVKFVILMSSSGSFCKSQSAHMSQLWRKTASFLLPSNFRPVPLINKL